MSKILSKLFPLFDHLYIYQNFEYESMDFLRWFLKSPFKRNLQKKHKLEWTSKARLLALTSLFLTVLVSVYFSWFFILIFIFLDPFILVVSQIILSPFELYQKNKIIESAKRKMAILPKIKVVAVVGSFAKTSTKNMLYTILWKDFRVVKTPKSFNTPISVARTVLTDVKDNTEIFIVEMDAYHPGDIRRLCGIVKPDLGVITSIAAQHLGRFGSMEKLAKAQFELAESLPKDGLLFLNSQDGWSSKLSPDYSNRKIFYGDKDSDYFAEKVMQTTDGLSFEIKTKRGEKVSVKLPVLGAHNVINFLSATAIANQLGLSLKRISERAEKILPTPHRLEVRKQGNMTIIDNTYNTNPTSSKSSLKLLNDLEGKQKILVTPGLVELGKEHDKENFEFALEAAKVCDEIIIVGENAKVPLLKGLESTRFPKQKTHLVSSTSDGLSLLKTLIEPGAVVLLENDLPDQYF